MGSTPLAKTDLCILSSGLRKGRLLSRGISKGDLSSLQTLNDHIQPANNYHKFKNQNIEFYDLGLRLGLRLEMTLVHHPAHISSYRPMGWPSPKSPKYIAGPISSLSKARFMPHIGNKDPFGMVITASTYLVLRSSGLTNWVGAS